MGTHKLSKSRYLQGLQCGKALWLHIHKPGLISPADPATQAIFDEGHLVGELAQKCFPGGILIEEDYRHPLEAVAATKGAIERGEKAIFEAGFIHDSVLVRSDILAKAGRTDKWDLIEVKMTTKVKDVHIPDLAIQRYVLEGSGIKVRRARLMHLNNQYVRKGELDVKKLFTIEDMTEQVDEMMAEVPARVKAMLKTLQLKKHPSVEIGDRCDDPYKCEFTELCWKHVPEQSIYNIPGLGGKKLAILEERGILELRDVPEDFQLTRAQALCVEAEKTGEVHVEPSEIAAHLDSLKYPLYYLDFETLGPAIPPYTGLKPYGNLPFQASVHIQKKPGGAVAHEEWLGDAKTDPRRPLAKFLAESIGPRGSVIAYCAGFEGQCLEQLADNSPKHAKKLRSMRARLWDLYTPFAAPLDPHARGTISRGLTSDEECSGGALITLQQTPDLTLDFVQRQGLDRPPTLPL